MSLPSIVERIVRTEGLGRRIVRLGLNPKLQRIVMARSLTSSDPRVLGFDHGPKLIGAVDHFHVPKDLGGEGFPSGLGQREVVLIELAIGLGLLGRHPQERLSLEDLGLHSPDLPGKEVARLGLDDQGGVHIAQQRSRVVGHDLGMNPVDHGRLDVLENVSGLILDDGVFVALAFDGHAVPL